MHYDNEREEEVTIDNGFYVYQPRDNIDFLGHFEPLSLPQIIQVIEGEVWLTGVSITFQLFEVFICGAIGNMVLTEDGVECNA